MSESPYAALHIPTWLISPEHATRMGSALWVFLWLWREGQEQESPYVRQVRGGASIRKEEIATALGLPVRTVRRHLATLREGGYLETWQDQHGFSAIASVWDAGHAPQEHSRGAKNGPPDNKSPRGANSGPPEISGGPILAHLDDFRGAINGLPENPPGPPLKVLKSLSVDSEYSEGSSSPPACGFNVTPTAKTASIVPILPHKTKRFAGTPIRAGLNGTASSAAVDAAAKAHRLRQEQAILHQLGRIAEWERPEFNRTLREILTAVPLAHLAEVFELAWLAYRFRGGAVRNPAGWWVETLRRTAQACLKAVAEDEAHGQD